MAKAAFDGFLELVPNKKHMDTVIAGETQDAKKGRSESDPAAIEIASFTFGPKDALKSAKKQRDQQKPAAESEGEGEGEGTQPKPLEGSRTGRQNDDYKFQITKQVEKSSPYLMRAYFSNSFYEKRREFNDFSRAKVTLRKRGSKADAPFTYLTVTFLGVHITGYKCETKGKEPPEETVEFCFQACEMKYRQQLSAGNTAPAIIKGWNLRDKKPLTLSQPSDD